MALFIFGAGATRGCSFVKPKEFPCLPPLDNDFFTQLQRVSNPKHQSLIKSVMEDIVELFGINFNVTMEIVFTMLEHTIRMLKTTKATRDFDPEKLSEKKERLKQAIAVVFEESLTQNEGRDQKTCQFHTNFVKNVLRCRDTIITFNYDCVLDFCLKHEGNGKWNPHYGYGFKLGPGGRFVDGHEYWQPTSPASSNDTIKLLKLHGSLHFQFKLKENGPRVHLKQRPYTKQGGAGVKFDIIPPEWHKGFDKKPYGTLWSEASSAINHSNHIVLIGYSLPLTDLHSTALFQTSVKSNSLKALVVVNPDQQARKRARNVLQRGISKDTRVLSFNYFDEFLAADRKLWES